MATPQQARLHLRVTRVAPQPLKAPGPKRPKVGSAPPLAPDAHDPPPPPYHDALRRFDCASAYGPKLNISRRERYERARRLGKTPPTDLEAIFAAHPEAAAFVWTHAALMHSGSRAH